MPSIPHDEEEYRHQIRMSELQAEAALLNAQASVGREQKIKELMEANPRATEEECAAYYDEWVKLYIAEHHPRAKDLNGFHFHQLVSGEWYVVGTYLDIEIGKKGQRIIATNINPDMITQILRILTDTTQKD